MAPHQVPDLLPALLLDRPLDPVVALHPALEVRAAALPATEVLITVLFLLQNFSSL